MDSENKENLNRVVEMLTKTIDWDDAKVSVSGYHTRIPIEPHGTWAQYKAGPRKIIIEVAEKDFEKYNEHPSIPPPPPPDRRGENNPPQYTITYPPKRGFMYRVFGFKI